jgi:hypothetical protein
MKHIKPKNTKTIKVNFSTNEISSENNPPESNKIAHDYLSSKTYSDWDIMIQEDNKLIFGFDYLYKNEMRYIPELDPSIVYFSSAQLFRKKIYHYKRELLQNTPFIADMDKINTPISTVMRQFEVFFQFASSYIIMLNSSLEAFINKTIHIDYTYTTKGKKGKEKDINWILKSAFFSTKIEEIIPDCTGKNFTSEFPKKYDSIKELKKIRNELIHLSPKTDISVTKYKEFYRKVIDFPYNESIYSVRDYINYHEENLIEECQCGQDFHFDINK